MAAKIGSLATSKVVQQITGTSPNAAPVGSGQLTLSGAQALAQAQVLTQNVAADLAEKSTVVQYPVLQVYCEKIVNSMAEKFRTFSGTVQMAIEVRESAERLEILEDRLASSTDTVTQALDASRGDWGNGMYYSGGYQVSFAAVKHGGKNFIQTAKVTFEIGASIN
jgi:hypothetical protein